MKITKNLYHIHMYMSKHVTMESYNVQSKCTARSKQPVAGFSDFVGEAWKCKHGIVYNHTGKQNSHAI